KDSAIDYTIKFQEIASELVWNDVVLISQYHRGFKIEVVKAMDLLSDIPTTFIAFSKKAIELDLKQYTSYLDLQNRSSTHHLK
ncbi:hypothetical protein FBU30_001708, partial [Linnemannia zychae]